jgi:hypothetical protein
MFLAAHGFFMNPATLIRSIYLGDRGCMAVVFDKTKRQLRIQVDCISLLRPGTDRWDYYTERDIENGWIVFSGVDTGKIQPENSEPNDFINEVSVEQDADQDGRYGITMSIGSVDATGHSQEVIMSVKSSCAHLEDAKGFRLTLD